MSRMCDFREGSRGRREERPRRVVQVATYANGRPYTPARGRYTERTAVEDYLDSEKAVVDLCGEQPTAGDFLRRILREMKIRSISTGVLSPSGKGRNKGDGHQS